MSRIPVAVVPTTRAALALTPVAAAATAARISASAKAAGAGSAASLGLESTASVVPRAVRAAIVKWKLLVATRRAESARRHNLLRTHLRLWNHFRMRNWRLTIKSQVRERVALCVTTWARWRRNLARRQQEARFLEKACFHGGHMLSSSEAFVKHNFSTSETVASRQ
ncbi:hypothetical protein HDU84_002983, partial [Entophlyctis sp. JEL0112]